VVFAQADPTSEASGGAGRLREAGIEVISGVLLEEATSVNADWMFVKSTGRPFVTLKLAGSLDGKVDSTGSERLMLTGAQAQVAVHQLRSTMDAIAVGAGTLAADDPRLTARGVEVRSQPLRVILGSGSIPPAARVLEEEGEVLVITERDPRLALVELARLGIQHVLLEGGPTVASAYLDAGVVDEVYWYVSAMLVGSGTAALTSLSTQIALDVTTVDVVGEDVCIVGVPIRGEA
jgi:diaminohydroxyphosphoribosylaminopyrimidine deaminase/5-amino-6-(5-phosphoribosylamino)uracil reductase